MLTLRDVGTGWTRYCGKTRNDDDPKVEPGRYLEYSGKRPDEITKKSLGLMACRQPNGRFTWLAPNEPWVKQVMDGALMFDYGRLPKPLTDCAALVGDRVYEKLRCWQREFFRHCVAALEYNVDYRRIGNVPLGGGKTLAGLTLLALGEHGLVVAPTYIQPEWKAEAKKWGFQEPITTTYESAYKFDGPLDVLVLDEAHLLKNPDSLRHQRILELSKRAKIVVGFTGSLMGGCGPLDLRSLRCIQPGAVPASDIPWRFIFGTDTRLEEVAPGRQAYVTEHWNHEKIAEWTRPWIYTVDLGEIIAELPEITYKTITVKTPKDYKVVASGGATTKSKSKRTAQMRQCTDGFVLNDAETPIRLSSEKDEAIAQQIEAIGEPVIVYAAWSESVELLKEALVAYNPSVLDGACADQSFQIDRFKRGETSVLIANSRFSAGMNLQSVCRTVIFKSLSSNPVDHKQAIARVWRPGQDRGVQIIYVQCEGTIDQRAHELVTAHENMSAAQIDALLEETE